MSLTYPEKYHTRLNRKRRLTTFAVSKQEGARFSALPNYNQLSNKYKLLDLQAKLLYSYFNLLFILLAKIKIKITESMVILSGLFFTADLFCLTAHYRHENNSTDADAKSNNLAYILLPILPCCMFLWFNSPE